MRPARTDVVLDEALTHVLALLTPPNRLACLMAVHTGLRIGDVLAIKSDQLAQRMTIREAKTGKSRRVHIPARLLDEVKAQAGAVWAFEGRIDPIRRHRCRQTVWKDVKRAQKALRLPQSLGTHSMRKAYAVKLMQRYGDLRRVQKALGHDDPTVTMLYAMADAITARHIGRK